MQPDSTTTTQPCRDCLDSERGCCAQCYASTGVSMAYCERHDAHPHGALEAAIHDLGAHDLGNNRYAYRGSSQWFTFDPADVTANGVVTAHIPMPSWWSPATPYAWRIWGAGDKAKARVYGVEGIPQRDLDAYSTKYGPGAWAQRITADIVTGKEVAA